MHMLDVVNKELTNIGVPYEFMRWTSPVQYPYFVGEYSETITDTEDGYKEYSLIVTGTTKGTWLELEQYKEKIENHFPNVGGLRLSTTDGAVVIFYANSTPVDTGDASLKRIQINLQVKEWKGLK